ncbi:NTP transferase domain-containing protein [Planctomycetaceae bacterium]|nr:NTP transferase domain-containing protein [Planctomycetaceae bacterium]
MPETSPIAIVLAAGKGTRMNSDLPKVLHEAAGKTLLTWVLDALSDAGIHDQIVVVGFGGEKVRAHIGARSGVEFAVQHKQLGTGDAVRAAAPFIKSTLAARACSRPVVVVCGDSPLLRASSIRRLLEAFQSTGAACLLGTAITEDPTGLGRIVRNTNKQFVCITEEKDATETERLIQEVNMSTYVFAADKLLNALGKINTDNAAGEYYLTDCPRVLLNAGEQVDAVACLEPSESLSVNTPQQLHAVAKALQAIQR